MSLLQFTKTVVRSLFSKPATAMYPIKKREFYANTRGSIHNEIDLCVFCGACAIKCPTKALVVKRDSKEWVIDRFRCITCNACVEACPKKCLIMRNTYTSPAAVKSCETYCGAEKPGTAPSGE